MFAPIAESVKLTPSPVHNNNDNHNYNLATATTESVSLTTTILPLHFPAKFLLPAVATNATLPIATMATRSSTTVAILPSATNAVCDNGLTNGVLQHSNSQADRITTTTNYR